MQETQVGSLDREEPLEEGVATYSSVPAWRVPWAEEPGGLQSVGSQSRRLRERTHTHQDSCLQGRRVRRE